MRIFKEFVIDIIKSFLIGVLVGTTIAVLFTVVGLLGQGFDLTAAIRIARNVAIVVGALEMVLSAGLILKGNEIRRLNDIEGWRKRFSRLNFVYVMLIMSYGIVLVGGMLDNVLFNIR
ncbi:hypothetical protein [Clostridium oryzae]|uniref:Uncharacterized protein n=1 Tax=Clostridium oryzae TaxID=1450648 RepID=A0A1V4ID46_9CLOT|nr:hypothetical protein [Clostridium oryzae]OPJ57863.1 hypothetical protein CLORY_38790 [Clostridium oryzae]